jgi:hypothetical protein
MSHKLKIILILAGLFSGVKALDQADISMETHWYNRAINNPASIARIDYVYLFQYS